MLIPLDVERVLCKLASRSGTSHDGLVLRGFIRQLLIEIDIMEDKIEDKEFSELLTRGEELSIEYE